MELTREELKTQLRFWILGYIESCRKHFDFKTPEGEKEFLAFQDRQFKRRDKIFRILDKTS